MGLREPLCGAPGSWSITNNNHRDGHDKESNNNYQPLLSSPSSRQRRSSRPSPSSYNAPSQSETALLGRATNEQSTGSNNHRMNQQVVLEYHIPSDYDAPSSSKIGPARGYEGKGGGMASQKSLLSDSIANLREKQVEIHGCKELASVPSSSTTGRQLHTSPLHHATEKQWQNHHSRSTKKVDREKNRYEQNVIEENIERNVQKLMCLLENAQGDQKEDSDMNDCLENIQFWNDQSRKRSLSMTEKEKVMREVCEQAYQYLSVHSGYEASVMYEQACDDFRANRENEVSESPIHRLEPPPPTIIDGKPSPEVIVILDDDDDDENDDNGNEKILTRKSVVRNQKGYDEHDKSDLLSSKVGIEPPIPSHVYIQNLPRWKPLKSKTTTDCCQRSFDSVVMISIQRNGNNDRHEQNDVPKYKPIERTIADLARWKPYRDDAKKHHDDNPQTKSRTTVSDLARWKPSHDVATKAKREQVSPKTTQQPNTVDGGTRDLLSPVVHGTNQLPTDNETITQSHEIGHHLPRKESDVANDSFSDRGDDDCDIRQLERKRILDLLYPSWITKDTKDNGNHDNQKEIPSNKKVKLVTMPRDPTEETLMELPLSTSEMSQQHPTEQQHPQQHHHVVVNDVKKKNVKKKLNKNITLTKQKLEIYRRIVTELERKKNLAANRSIESNDDESMILSHCSTKNEYQLTTIDENSVIPSSSQHATKLSREYLLQRKAELQRKLGNKKKTREKKTEPANVDKLDFAKTAGDKEEEEESMMSSRCSTANDNYQLTSDIDENSVTPSSNQYASELSREYLLQRKAELQRKLDNKKKTPESDKEEEEESMMSSRCSTTNDNYQLTSIDENSVAPSSSSQHATKLSREYLLQRKDELQRKLGNKKKKKIAPMMISNKRVLLLEKQDEQANIDRKLDFENTSGDKEQESMMSSRCSTTNDNYQLASAIDENSMAPSSTQHATKLSREYLMQRKAELQRKLGNKKKITPEKKTEPTNVERLDFEKTAGDEEEEVESMMSSRCSTTNENQSTSIDENSSSNHNATKLNRAYLLKRKAELHRNHKMKKAQMMVNKERDLLEKQAEVAKLRYEKSASEEEESMLSSRCSTNDHPLTPIDENSSSKQNATVPLNRTYLLKRKAELQRNHTFKKAQMMVTKKRVLLEKQAEQAKVAKCDYEKTTGELLSLESAILQSKQKKHRHSLTKKVLDDLLAERVTLLVKKRKILYDKHNI